jgi:hypothetical protein
MRALGASIATAMVAVFAAAPVVWAQGQISDIRVGKQPEFDRIVLDLSVDPVDATQVSTSDQFVLELSASKPQLSLEKEDKLADLKIFLRDSANGTQLVVTKNNRPVQVFRIPAAPGSGKGDRLVLDVGRSGGRLNFPQDATRVPEGGRATETAELTRPEPAPEPAPVRRPEATKPREPDVAVPPPPAPPTQERRPEGDLLGDMGSQRSASRPREAVAPPPPPPVTPPPREPTPDESSQASGTEDDPKDEDVWVLVRAIDIQGVTGTSPSVQDLNELKLAVSPVRGGFVAPRDNRPVQRLPLRALVGDDRNGRRLSGSVLQLIVETIAAEYTRNEKLGTRVDIRRADLEGLMQGGDGRLVIRVREQPARAAGSAEP